MSMPTELPAGFKAYGRSPEFTPDNLPPQLRAAHSTRAGTWGLLHVLEGSLRFEFEPPHGGRRLVSAGDTVVIPSQAPHHVDFVEPGRFYIEFFRATP